MKNKKLWLILPMLLLILSGCNLSEDDPTETTQDTDNTSSTSNVVTRNHLGDQFYRPALDENGRYKTSNIRGITLNLNSGINLSLFEKDLMRLSQDYFSTENHFIQEGQYLSRDTVQKWIDRKSEDNPEGLNPEDPNAGKERANREDPDYVPNYLNSILEFDFFTETDNGLQLSGMTIGLALNSIDYYQPVQFGDWFSKEIPQEEMIQQGQTAANAIVSRIRTIEGLEQIPVTVALYEQTAEDDLSGGVFVAIGNSENGSNAIGNWETIDERRIIYPLEGTDSAEANAFANFQSEVEAFFPNISGITGRAHYIDNNLSNLTINIMAQFYGEGEMIAYTQFLKQSATTYLPQDLSVEIIVESPNSVEAFLTKEATDVEYFSYVFD